MIPGTAVGLAVEGIADRAAVLGAANVDTAAVAGFGEETVEMPWWHHLLERRDGFLAEPVAAQQGACRSIRQTLVLVGGLVFFQTDNNCVHDNWTRYR